MNKFLLVPLLWLLTACPSYETIRPRIAGSVIDASTNKPIQNAEIHVKPESTTYFSNDEGNFRINPKKGWVWYPVVFPVDRYYPSIEIEAFKMRYSTSIKSVSGNKPSDDVIFSLTPLQQ